MDFRQLYLGGLILGKLTQSYKKCWAHPEVRMATVQSHWIGSRDSNEGTAVAAVRVQGSRKGPEVREGWQETEAHLRNLARRRLRRRRNHGPGLPKSKGRNALRLRKQLFVPMN